MPKPSFLKYDDDDAVETVKNVTRKTNQLLRSWGRPDTVQQKNYSVLDANRNPPSYLIQFLNVG